MPAYMYVCKAVREVHVFTSKQKVLVLAICEQLKLLKLSWCNTLKSLLFGKRKNVKILVKTRVL